MVIPNERLKMVSEQRITLANAFEVADDVLRQAVQSISELIQTDAYINLDFADVTSVMKDAGYAHMGVGTASGKDKAQEAAKAAITSPLLETSINGAKGVIINITASPDIDLEDAETASAIITDAAHPDANVIWGVTFDDTMDDTMRITMISTGVMSKDDPATQASDGTENLGLDFINSINADSSLDDTYKDLDAMFHRNRSNNDF